MNIHFVGEISVEDTRKAHLTDLAVQEKYGVTYHQYRFNEEAGMVYCLMEGPDKESGASTHRGQRFYRVPDRGSGRGGLYDLFMGEVKNVDHGLVRRKDGQLDTGYRYILTLDIIAKTLGRGSIDFAQLKLPKKPKNRALQLISGFDGNEIRTGGGFDSIIAVFESPENVLRCAHEIQKEFLSNPKTQDLGTDDIAFNMGISVGQPPHGKGRFFCKSDPDESAFIPDCRGE